VIVTPDILGDLSRRLEAGEPIDWQLVRQQQAIEIVRAGRQFMVEAVESMEAADEQLNDVISSTA